MKTFLWIVGVWLVSIWVVGLLLLAVGASLESLSLARLSSLAAGWSH